ncbi:MAG: tRNA pseudouridine(55) synthase TruB [Candidatus Marinimicrobia bacterium]|nr:tRNA pseudouridine(55) synthase TruB [Candidatus Neomarinimicrobiota bacterium]MAQ73675.1 tRNA pseudouridine(55) synthase TruB [Candidatus Neomarinimicrobiota bacterium]
MIYNIYKPVEWTSFDVVKKVRIITKEKKVGHAGTLDPFAEGILIIGTGKDTKALSSISNNSKTYKAKLILGRTTDTMDNKGKIIESKIVPRLEMAKVNSVINSFLGDYKHYPPMYSAKKVNGVRLYKLARENKIVKRNPILSNILNIKLNDFKESEVSFSVSCSKGTYIRVLGRDIAKKLGTVGYLDQLIRTKVGTYNLSSAIKIKDFEKQWKSITD